MDDSQTRIFSLTRTRQYGIAILSVVLVAILRWAINPLLGGQLPYFFFVLPIVLACRLGGLWPGLVATGLSLICGYRFLSTGESIPIHTVSFGALGIGFSLVFYWSQKAANAEWQERKKAEEKVHFLSDLNEALLPLDDAGQIMELSVRMLGEHLGVDWCGYAEAESGKEDFQILARYTRGAASSAGTENILCEFGDEARRVLRENRAYIVNDTESEFFTAKDISVYRRAEIRSLVCVPLKKQGYFVARLALHQQKPRRWSNEETQLITIVANRCWESAARARAVKRLKDSDERHRAFIANSSEGIWCYELDAPIPVSLPVDEQ